MTPTTPQSSSKPRARVALLYVANDTITRKSVVVYSTPMTQNRPELPGSGQSRQTTNHLVTQQKIETTGPIQAYGSLIRWSRVRAPPAPRQKPIFQDRRRDARPG